MSRRASAVITAIALSSSAFAGTEAVFFGFDRNTTGAIPLVPAPNSAAARASFAAALPGPARTQNFDTYAPNTLPASWDFGPGLAAGFTQLTPNSARMYNQPINGLYPTSGQGFLDSFAATPNRVLWRLDFSTPVQALGFDTSDMDDWINAANVTPVAWEIVLDGFASGGPRTYSLMPGFLSTTLLAIPSGSRTFWGVITDETFTSATLVKPAFPNGTGGEGFAIDDFTVAIPAPGPAALLGLGGLIAARRRRA